MLAQKIGVAHPAINVLVGAPERAHEKTRIENAPRDYHVDALPYPAFSLEISGFLSHQYLHGFICTSGFLVGFSLISSRCFDMIALDKS